MCGPGSPPDLPFPAPAACPVDECAAGDLINACAIDLPQNDVVEAIEFERFFVLNLRVDEYQRPMTMMSTWASMSTRISDEQLETLGPALSMEAPLSSDRADWAPRDDPAAGSSEERAQAFNENIAVFDNPINTGGFRLAFYLPYRQEWKLLGYSRGRMVNSLTLSPQEEQTIEIFTWDRSTRSLDSTSVYDSEQTNESAGTRRDTSDITKDIARQSGFELTSDAKVGFKVEVVNADISAGMNAKTSINSAEKEARQSIVEATSRAATHVRSSRTLKVLETHEYGQETRVTRKLRNHNTCHTLTTAFFEILAIYRVSTFLKTEAIRLVVLLKSSELSKLKSFDRRIIRSHERTLSLALLDSTLGPGLDAARYLDARDRACALLCAGCDCGVDTGAVARDDEWEALAAALVKLGQVVAALRGYNVLFPASVVLARLEPPGAGGLGATDIRRHMLMRSLAQHAPRILVDLAGLGLAGPTAAHDPTHDADYDHHDADCDADVDSLTDAKAMIDLGAPTLAQVALPDSSQMGSRPAHPPIPLDPSPSPHALVLGYGNRTPEQLRRAGRGVRSALTCRHVDSPACRLTGMSACRHGGTPEVTRSEDLAFCAKLLPEPSHCWNARKRRGD